MTEKQLKEIKIINLEIRRIESVLNSTPCLSELQKEYSKMLNIKKETLYKKKIETEQYISEIPDAEIRLILSLKYIDLRSWKYISKTLHYDRSTLSKKVKKFFENNSK